MRERRKPRETGIVVRGVRFAEGEPIGSGGMGAVSEAFDTVLLRGVAVKTMHPEIADEPERRERFIQEARISGQLDHPGVVPVYDLGHSEKGLQLVMKLVRGVTLTRVFNQMQASRLQHADLRRICLMMIKACEAVSFAHSRGVIHRDLKPDNIMVGEHGELYVMDWGVALVTEADAPEALRVRLGRDLDRDREHGMAGTPAYMAPEQAAIGSHPIDERTDVYGIGGILYYFLTRRAPHAARTTAASLERAAAGTIRPIADHAIWPNLPPGLAQIAMRALAREPGDRYPSADALKADLEQFLDGGGWFATRSFRTGETIVVEGEPGESAYIIMEGECAVYKTISGTRTLMRRMKAGDVFGETAVLTRKPRSATVVAESPVTLKVVTRESLEHELARNPWLAAFIRALAARFLEADSRLAGESPTPGD